MTKKNPSHSLLLREFENPPERVVACSFDDGPSEWTEPILDALRAHEGHATFFVVGRSIRGREGTLRRAVREGHELGNHTMTHPDLTRKRRWSIRRELGLTNALIERAVGQAPRLFRPPFMRYDERVLSIAERAGLEWTVLDSDGVSPKDFKIDDPTEIADAVLASIRPGAILDLHDGRPPRERVGATLPTRQATVEAVPLILSRLVPSGYRVATVSELFGLRTAR